MGGGKGGDEGEREQEKRVGGRCERAADRARWAGWGGG